jgi:hypothetical protein
MSSYESQEKHAQNNEKSEAPKSLPVGFLIAIGIFSMITMGILMTHKDKQQRVFNLVKNKTFLFSLVVIVMWSYYCLYHIPDDLNDDYKKATKQAIIAFIIALLAHLELKMAPYWLVWITAYYLGI